MDKEKYIKKYGNVGASVILRVIVEQKYILEPQKDFLLDTLNVLEMMLYRA